MTAGTTCHGGAFIEPAPAAKRGTFAVPCGNAISPGLGSDANALFEPLPQSAPGCGCFALWAMVHAASADFGRLPPEKQRRRGGKGVAGLEGAAGTPAWEDVQTALCNKKLTEQSALHVLTFFDF